MVGSLFGDTIVVKNERKDSKTGEVKTFNSETMGEYVGIMDAKAYLRTPNGKLKEFNCVNIISIFDDDRKPISWDCNENSFVPNSLNELDVKKIAKKPIVGGTLIAIGGLILISQNETDLEDINVKQYKNTTTFALALITIGGVLIALGS